MKCWAGWITNWSKTARRNINNLRYAADTTLMAESKEDLKRLWMKVKEYSERGDLKLNIQETKIMTCSPKCLCLVTQSCPTLCNPINCSLPGSSVHGDSSSKNIRFGWHALLQGIFPTQGLNPGLPHCRQILHHLSHQGSPKTPEWVALPSPGSLPSPGIKTGSPALQAHSLPVELPKKPL